MIFYLYKLTCVSTMKVNYFDVCLCIICSTVDRYAPRMHSKYSYICFPDYYQSKDQRRKKRDIAKLTLERWTRIYKNDHTQGRIMMKPRAFLIQGSLLTWLRQETLIMFSFFVYISVIAGGKAKSCCRHEICEVCNDQISATVMVTKFHLGHFICLTFFKIMEDCFSVLCIVPPKHVFAFA